MRVLCENCGTTYKIPDSKLVREVNRATCRKCGHQMVIRLAAPVSASPALPTPIGEQEEERTLVTSMADVERRAREQAMVLEAATARVATVPEEQTPPPAPAPMIPQPVAQETLFNPDDSDISDDLAPEMDLGTEDVPTAVPAEEETPPLPPPPAPKTGSRPIPPVRDAATTTMPTLYGVPTPVPEGMAMSQVGRPPRSHDPSGDMTMVLMGSLIAVFGALILAFNGGGNAAARFLGLLMALWGTFATFLVVATSDRGRKPASVIISLLLSTFGALLFAAVAYVVVPSGNGPSLLSTLTRDSRLSAPRETPAVAEAPKAPASDAAPTGVDKQLDSILSTQGSTPAPASDAAPATPAPETAPAPSTGATPSTAPALSPAPVPATGSSESAEGAPPVSRQTATDSRAATPRNTTTTAAPTADNSSRTSSRDTVSRFNGSSSRSASAAPATSTPPAATTSRTTAPAPTTTAAASTGSTFQPTVVDTMLRTNQGVKRCFGDEKARSGQLPSRVDVKMTILSTGKVSSAAVKTAEYAGTPLDSCLSGAIKGIQFPPFDGDAKTMTYPFLL